MTNDKLTDCLENVGASTYHNPMYLQGSSDSAVGIAAG
jgi:hypothetical protein